MISTIKIGDINIIEILECQLKDYAEQEVDKMISEEVERFKYELMNKKDEYITFLMKNIRIYHEQKTIDNMPRYLITIENTYRIES